MSHKTKIILRFRGGKAKALPVHEGDKALIDRLGQTKYSRASYIVPTSKLLRKAFWLARLFGLTRWTRTWNVKWSVIRKGIEYPGFDNRYDAVDFETRLIAGINR